MRTKAIAAGGLAVWILVGSAARAIDSARVWHDAPGCRWAELEVPAEGKTGFTLMPPEQTGITFKNTLDDEDVARNRVLQNGSGVAAGDFDNDGWCDLYFCNMDGAENRLYKNLGHWKFKDVTAEAGVALPGELCRGAVFADINGDGAFDLLVSTIGHGVIVLLNDGHGHFKNVTKAAGTFTRFGAMTLALADIDGTGPLALFVTNNRKEDIRDRGSADLQQINGHLIIPPWYKDRLILINDKLFEYGEPDVLYRNDGQGHFTPVSWTDGTFLDEDGQPLVKPPGDWGLTMTFRDINGDSAPDIYVCNDYWTPDRLWLNDGHGRFRAIDRLALRNTPATSMGVDFADLNREGHLDFFATDMLSRDHQRRMMLMPTDSPPSKVIGSFDDRPQIARNTLQHNRGDGTFEEIANFADLAGSDWSWQPLFLDVDLDGYEDLLIGSGHIRDFQDTDTSNRIKELQAKDELVPNSAVKLGGGKSMDAAAHFTAELLAGNRMHPRLDLPIFAFRNRRNFQFEEVTAAWGLNQLAIHNGMALADLDNDGDLDLIVNNLGSVAGLYRNDTTAPRVAVRLKGAAPNTQGIGARIKLLGGAVPMQSQEIVCGGRYLSGCEAQLSFAAGQAKGGMTLLVTWRNGKVSTLTDLLPNRIYEVDEAVTQALPPPAAPPPPLFTDVSDLLKHTHHENEFDDFARQPLLPNRLSRLGPGVAWYDVNGDGRDDLIVGSGKDGKLAVFLNDGQGGFTPLAAPALARPSTRDQTGLVAWRADPGRVNLLVGAANYEDGATNGESVLRYQFEKGAITAMRGIPGTAASTGPLALGDIDGTGSLALFVGGRVVPGRWPEPAGARLYRSQAGVFVLDQANTAKFASLGLVTGALFTDLNGDGFSDLVVTVEWGPISVFLNDGHGNFTDATETLGFAKYRGWWNGITVGDLDGSGRLAIIATNWGRNSQSEHRYDAAHPLRLYYGDFTGRGGVEFVESYFDMQLAKIVPSRGLTAVSAALPFVKIMAPTYKQYGAASVDDIYGAKLKTAALLTADTLDHMLFLNRGDHFEAVPLPFEAQVAPAFGVSVADCDGDGAEDIFLTQNFFPTEIDTPRLDAGRGLWLKSNGRGGLTAMPGQVSGIKVYGDARGCAVGDFDADGRVDVVVAQNGAATKLYHNIGAKPGLRVRLAGPPGNPDGIGAQVRLFSGEKPGPIREIHAGSGYWSQDSTVPVLAVPVPPTKVWVRWPGGNTTEAAIPASAKEIVVSIDGRVSAVPADVRPVSETGR